LIVVNETARVGCGEERTASFALFSTGDANSMVAHPIQSHICYAERSHSIDAVRSSPHPTRALMECATLELPSLLENNTNDAARSSPHPTQVRAFLN